MNWFKVKYGFLFTKIKKEKRKELIRHKLLLYAFLVELIREKARECFLMEKVL